MKPFYQDEHMVLYHGDMREIVPALLMQPGTRFNVIVADPPYEATDCSWDQWPDGWPELLRPALVHGGSLWCYGSLKLFLQRATEFSAYTLVQDIVWEKQNGSGMHVDRFRRVHESLAQFVPIGLKWGFVYKSPPRVRCDRPKTIRSSAKPAHWHGIGKGQFASGDWRLQRSVIQCRNSHGSTRNETEKPPGLARIVIEYSSPPDGLVLVPFAGSGSEMIGALQAGRRVIGIEKRESQCEIAASRIEHLHPEFL